MQDAAGSEQQPYKLLIVGGGPAGISVLVRAIRIGVIKELLVGDESAGVAGVCLMEQGSSEQLGGGNLQNYQINSNTHAYKFFTNVVKENADVVPPEHTAGSALESLVESKVGRALDLLGRRPAPLPQAGKFLCEVAQCVKAEIHKYESSACMTRTKLTRLQRVNSELWKAYYAKPSSPAHSGAPQEQCVFAKHVVLATGGLQRAPQLNNPAHQAKLMLSEHVLSANGLRDLRTRIGQSQSFRKIVVVGGSHSAFSAAWICLNRLQTSSGLKDDGVHLGPNSICIVHRTDIQVYYNSAREAEQDGYTFFDRTNSQGQVYPFGGLRGDAKDLYTSVQKTRENRVRLFKVSECDDVVVNRLYNEATVIIWACGYETRITPIQDEHGNPIRLKYDKSQADVDEDANILLDDANATPVGRLYGVGLGYGLKATLADGSVDGSSGRADGFAVYLKRAASLVLASVVGPKVFGQGNNTWQERRSALLRRCLAPDSPRFGVHDREGFESKDSDTEQEGYSLSPFRRCHRSGSPGRAPLLSPDRQQQQQQQATMQRLSRRPQRRGSQTEAAATPPPTMSLQPRARSLPPARGRIPEAAKPVSLRQPAKARERYPEIRMTPDSPPPRTAPVAHRRPSQTRVVLSDSSDERVVKKMSSPGPLLLSRGRKPRPAGTVPATPQAQQESPRTMRASTKHVKSRSISCLPVAAREQRTVTPERRSREAQQPPPESPTTLLSPVRKEAYKLPKQMIGTEIGSETAVLSPHRRSASVDRASRSAGRRRLQPVAAGPIAASILANADMIEPFLPTSTGSAVAATALATPVTATPAINLMEATAEAVKESGWLPASPIRASLERFPPTAVETIVR